MNHFDFIAKKIFFFTMLSLVLTVAFVLPLKNSINSKCDELLSEVQSLEVNRTVLLNDLNELDNPTTEMKND